MSSKTAAKSLAALALLTLLTAAPRALAQVSPADAAVAQSMFDEGRRLMSEKRYAEACPKLQDSLRLDPALGTLLNLAVCHEKLGRTASAWTEYRDAESLARREGRNDRAAYAREHVTAIEPHLSHLTIVRSEGESDLNLDVRLDDASVGAAALGTALPIDPGEHKIEARARGKVAWSTTVTVGADADSKKVEIPRLADEPKPEPVVVAPPVVTPPPAAAPPAPAPEPAPPPPPRNETRRTITYVAGGVGIAAFAAGTIAGVEAISKWSARNDACPGDRCTADGLDADKTARRWALVSDVGLGIGVVGIGVATYLLLTEPPSATPSPAVGVRVVPNVASNGGGLTLAGAW